MAAGLDTKVPEEGDDLEDFEESDECQSRQSFDDGVGGGGIAQASSVNIARVRCVATVLKFYLWL